MQHRSDPDELRGKGPCDPKVKAAENCSQGQDECEEYDGIGRKPKGVGTIVDTAAIETFGCRVTLNADAGHGDEAAECKNEQDPSPKIVPVPFQQPVRIWVLGR